MENWEMKKRVQSVQSHLYVNCRENKLHLVTKQISGCQAMGWERDCLGQRTRELSGATEVSWRGGYRSI